MPKMKIKVHEAQDWKQAFDKSKKSAVQNCEKLLAFIKNYEGSNNGAWGCVGSMNYINDHLEELVKSFPGTFGLNHS